MPEAPVFSTKKRKRTEIKIDFISSINEFIEILYKINQAIKY